MIYVEEHFFFRKKSASLMTPGREFRDISPAINTRRTPKTNNNTAGGGARGEKCIPQES